MLVGIIVAELHPTVVDINKHSWGHLRLLISKFGTGHLLEGALPPPKPYIRKFQRPVFRGRAIGEEGLTY